MKLSELLQSFPRVRLAREEDNTQLLQMVEANPMKSDGHRLFFERRPSFFSLLEAQGEMAVTFAFLQRDGTVSGLGSISLSRMSIHGQDQWVAYQGDLRHSPQMERETKIQFYQFFEELMRIFPSLDEFRGCQFNFATILDGNERAKRALLESQARRGSKIFYQPFYSFTTVNILGHLPLRRLLKKGRVQTWGDRDPSLLKDFLLKGDAISSLNWSEQEAERRLRHLKRTWADFHVLLSDQGEIEACCLLATDYGLRRPRLLELSPGLRVLNHVLGLFGQPQWSAAEPLRVGHLAFLRVKGEKRDVLADKISRLLQAILREQRDVPLQQRFHTLSFQVLQSKGLGALLWRHGFINMGLQATLYQLQHQQWQGQTPLLPETKQQPVFDFLFH